jgi:putative DNA primase/helicase
MSFEITTEADLLTLPTPFDQPGYTASTLITKRLSDIEAKPISWLWPGRIARGKLTIIAGNPGIGKTQITASIAAIVTKGSSWPVTNDLCERGKILFLTAEDDAADTVRPRLEAAGADLNLIHVIEGVSQPARGNGIRHSRTFSLLSDLNALEEKLAELGEVAAVIIDPISAYLSGVDSHKNAEVRSILTPLADLAARHNTAIIGVSHLNKAASVQVLMRVSGSLAFVAAARAAWLVAPDPDDNSRRLLLPLKNNLGRDTHGLAYSIESVNVACATGLIETSRIKWESTAVTRTADDVMQAGTQRRSSAMAQAKDWLTGVLADGPVPATEVLSRAEEDGLNETTVRRAGKDLGVKSKKSEFEGGWEWSLSSKKAEPAQDGHQCS